MVPNRTNYYICCRFAIHQRHGWNLWENPSSLFFRSFISNAVYISVMYSSVLHSSPGRILMQQVSFFLKCICNQRTVFCILSLKRIKKLVMG